MIRVVRLGWLILPALLVSGAARSLCAQDAKPAKAADKAAAVDVVPADGVDANADPQTLQFLQQFRPIYRAELHFIRNVCEPTKEQYQKITASGEPTLQDAVKKFVDFQKSLRQQRGGFRDQPIQPDPRKMVEQGLAVAVTPHLTAKQQARYQAEIEKRTANRKQVAVHNLVAKLDRDLVLTAEQRDKLGQALLVNWNDAWCQSLEVFLYGDNFIPNLPDQHVVPLLNETQKKVWQGRQRNNRIFFGGFGGFFPGMIMEEEAVEVKVEPNEIKKEKSDDEEGGCALQASAALPVLGLLLIGQLQAEIDVDAPPEKEPEVTDEDFDQWVFNGTKPAAGRSRLDSLLLLQIEDIQRTCSVTDAQKKKLQLAGRGDIKRLFDRIEELRKKFQLLKHDEQRANQIWQDIQPLQLTLNSGAFDDRSFFRKTLKSTLTGEQAAQYEKADLERRMFHYRAVVELVVGMLDNTLALRAAQRDKLVQLVLAETAPVRKSGQYDYYLVLYQMSQLPEAKLKPLFDGPQWKLLSQQLGQGKAMEQFLRQGGYLDKE